MISLIIVFYNYFTWLFTGSVPMEHINQDLSILTLFVFTFVELLIEIGLIRFIIDLLVSIRFRIEEDKDD